MIRKSKTVCKTLAYLPSKPNETCLLCQMDKNENLHDVVSFNSSQCFSGTVRVYYTDWTTPSQSWKSFNWEPSQDDLIAFRPQLSNQLTTRLKQNNIKVLAEVRLQDNDPTRAIRTIKVSNIPTRHHQGTIRQSTNRKRCFHELFLDLRWPIISCCVINSIREKALLISSFNRREGGGRVTSDWHFSVTRICYWFSQITSTGQRDTCDSWNVFPERCGKENDLRGTWFYNIFNKMRRGGGDLAPFPSPLPLERPRCRDETSMR